MTKALQDPRLKAKGRLAVKTIIASVTAQIRAIDKAAASARQTAKETAAKTKADRIDKHWQNIIDSIQLRIDKAELTPTLRDDIARLKEMRKALLAQIKAGHEVADAQSKLVTVEGQIAQKEKERTANQKAIRDAAIQRRQFRAIGLGPEGEDIIPGVKNLQKQFEQLSKSAI